MRESNSLSLPEKDQHEYNLLEQAMLLKEKGYFPELEVREIVKLLENKSKKDANY